MIRRLCMALALVLSAAGGTGLVAPACAAQLDRAKTGPLPGDPAPPIRAAAWLRGKPIEAYAKGKVYVVDLWATWCGPCLSSMPLLRKYQDRYSGKLTVVAMNVLEMAPQRVPALVASRADSMPLYVAIDSIPPGKEANEGLMAAAFFGSGTDLSIPRTYLIDGFGRVAWIGTPSGLEKPLAQVLAGTWDLAGHAAEYQRGIEAELAFGERYAPIGAAIEARQWSAAFESCDAVIAADSSYAPRIARSGFVLLAATILRGKDATREECAIALRSLKRALELERPPDWRLELMAAQAARAAGDTREAERYLGEARRHAPADSKALVPATLEGLPGTK